jgi:hypothetical protein
VSQRFSEAGAADPAIAAPVVAFLIEHAAEVEAVRYRFTEEASKLITHHPSLEHCARRRVARRAVEGRVRGFVSSWRPGIG